ncbi:MAG: GHMP family kinase ATP-binding protein [Bdellovibrionales bacterium]
MIISQTPFRVSFFGGGTDFPLWYREHGGSVLSTTINKYAYLTCRHLPPFFEHKHRIVYSQVETVSETAKIVHPAVRNIFEYMKVEEGLEVHYDGDLPARSGLGSSSSFTVGLLNTLFAMRGQMKSKKELADLALHIEQNVIKETVGSQDQIAAAYGGFNRIDFHNDESYSVRPMILPQKRVDLLNGRLMLFFTGFSRLADTIEKSKIENFKAKSAHLQKMQNMVGEAIGLLQSDSGLDDFGRLLHESWRLKRELSSMVTNSKLDEIYQTGLDHGALGGKILGAGGGGFILFYAPLEKHPAIGRAFKDLIQVDFKFEYGGSQIILYNPDIASQGLSS